MPPQDPPLGARPGLPGPALETKIRNTQDHEESWEPPPLILGISSLRFTGAASRENPAIRGQPHRRHVTVTVEGALPDGRNDVEVGLAALADHEGVPPSPALRARPHEPSTVRITGCRPAATTAAISRRCCAPRAMRPRPKVGPTGTARRGHPPVSRWRAPRPRWATPTQRLADRTPRRLRPSNVPRPPCAAHRRRLAGD